MAIRMTDEGSTIQRQIYLYIQKIVVCVRAAFRVIFLHAIEKHIRHYKYG